MKNIGVVTWYKNGNYGGTLQAYALMRTLQKNGCNVEHINYDKTNKISKAIRNLAFHILFLKSALSRDRIYHFVNKEFLQTSKFAEIDEIKAYSEKYDTVICGSDQIWSSLNGVDPVYFLQFVPENKRVAYAPSIGVPSIQEKFIGDFANCVKTIPRISIRETQGADYIESLTGIKPKVVLDPTFLLERVEWEELASDNAIHNNKLIPHKYIICYFLGDDNNYNSYVNSFCKKTKFPVYYVSSKRKNYGEKQLVCDPFEFIGLLKNAAYVLTDSFHGTVLSINLDVRVGVFERFRQDDLLNQNSRIQSVLEILDCKDLLLDPDESPERLIQQCPISTTTTRRIDKLRKESINYLLNALEK